MKWVTSHNFKIFSNIFVCFHVLFWLIETEASLLSIFSCKKPKLAKLGLPRKIKKTKNLEFNMSAISVQSKNSQSFSLC